MDSLLFLAHRIPYPPNKGDKIRSFRWLEALGRHYRVHLGTFVDEPADARHLPRLRELCAEVLAVPIRPRRRRLASLRALVSGGPLGLAYYASPRLAAFVEARRSRVDAALAFSSTMAPYLLPLDSSVRRVADYVDLDSEKWAQYARGSRWPLRALYRREARALGAFERAAARRLDATVFVSDAEAEAFRRRAPELAGRTVAIRNGVDAAFFDPARSGPSPYASGEEVVVFTGAMDYGANADAIEWFARDAFPFVRRAVPRARLVVVGARPLPRVRRLAALDGVRVTGTVDDVRPYLGHARLAVAPMRIARGVQNKILEAMAMGRPVVATSAGVEGLDWPASWRGLVADRADELAARVVGLLEAPFGRRERLGAEGRRWVLERYDWETSQRRMITLLAGTAGERPAAVPAADRATGS